MNTLDDDLTIIRGIGVATQAKLQHEGIRTFAQLAAVPDPLRAALDKLGSADEWKWWRKAAQKQIDAALRKSGGGNSDAAAPVSDARASATSELPGGPGAAGSDLQGDGAEKSAAALTEADAAARTATTSAAPEPSAGGAGTDTRTEMMVRITSKREGFRRGGLIHTRKPVERAGRSLTLEQMVILVAEPVLSVELVFENGRRFALKAWPPTAAQTEEMVAIGLDPPA